MGKQYSDYCYNCGESKAAIRYSQQIKDPIFCAIVSNTEDGMECEAEFDRHCFVMTDKQIKEREEGERAYAEFLGEQAKFMEASL